MAHLKHFQHNHLWLWWHLWDDLAAGHKSHARLVQVYCPMLKPGRLSRHGFKLLWDFGQALLSRMDYIAKSLTLRSGLDGGHIDLFQKAGNFSEHQAWTILAMCAGAPSWVNTYGASKYSDWSHGSTSSFKSARYASLFTLTPSSMKIRGVFRPSVVIPAWTMTDWGFCLLNTALYSKAISFLFLANIRSFWVLWMLWIVKSFSSVNNIGSFMPRLTSSNKTLLPINLLAFVEFESSWTLTVLYGIRFNPFSARTQKVVRFFWTFIYIA